MTGVAEHDIAQLQAMDERAWHDLQEQYFRRVYFFVKRYVDDHQTAEDLTQDVFLGAVKGIAKFDRDPREYQILPKAFIGKDGKLTHMRVSKLEWARDPDTGRKISKEIQGSEEDLPADYVFLSIGFTGHDTPAVFDRLGVETDWGTVNAEYGKFATNIDNVFAAGDVRRGASLIVWAIAEGRGAARAIDEYLMGESDLSAPLS